MNTRRRVAGLLLLLLLCLATAPACGGEDAERLRDDARERAERVRDRVERARDRLEATRERLAARVRNVLEDIRQAVPEAGRDTRPPGTRGRTQTNRIDAYLTETLRSVDAYWTRTLAASDLREPRVAYVWVPPGDTLRTGCDVVADDNAAFFCPADDTIYVAQRLASELWRGVNDDFPGQRAGYGRAVGDFGLAYVLAHEYAHNVQHELGFYSLSPRGGLKAFELQADCMAGLWGNSVYREGRLKPGDVEEAISTALAAGDFDYRNAMHHGTPDERRRAWLLGYRSGEPARCQAYVPV